MGPPTVRHFASSGHSGRQACNTNRCAVSRVCVRNRQALKTLCSAAVGIDLGTTNSVVAILQKGETHPTVIRDTSGAFTIPSIVSYTDGKDILVGEAAKQQLLVNPLNTFYSVKRLIGKRHNEIQDLGSVYSVTADDQAGVQLQCPAVGAAIKPQQVSAEILRHLLQLASQHLSGEVPDQVVITVPAYFNEQQRAATLEAAHLAGVKKVSLIQEPVAAAMAFGFGKPFDAETLLVFDLGGGTFDLSVVDSFEGIMEVLATNGDPNLGGDDFDRAIAGWLLQQQQQQQQVGSNSRSNGQQLDALDAVTSEVLAALLAAAEASKCRLTEVEQTMVALPVIEQAAKQQQQQQQIELTRQQMHTATAQLRERLWEPLQAIADDCKLEYECSTSSIEQQLAATDELYLNLPEDHSEAHNNNVSSSSSSSSNSSSSNGAASLTAAAADPYAPKPRKLTAVLLVGGATRMPIIQQGLQILTGLKPRSDVDPEQAVALGAAIQAAVLMGISSGLELMDGSYVEEFHNRSTGF